MISVGHIAAGSAAGHIVMPSELTLTGTARCFTQATQAIIDGRMRDLAQGLAAMHGATAICNNTWITTPLVNRPEQTAAAAAAARVVAGDGAVDINHDATTGGEDFAFMLEAKPGAFIMLGAGAGPDGVVHGLHTPKYDFNDAIIPSGVAWWVRLVEQELSSGD